MIEPHTQTAGDQVPGKGCYPRVNKKREHVRRRGSVRIAVSLMQLCDLADFSRRWLHAPPRRLSCHVLCHLMQHVASMIKPEASKSWLLALR